MDCIMVVFFLSNGDMGNSCGIHLMPFTLTVIFKGLGSWSGGSGSFRGASSTSSPASETVS